MQPSTAQTLTLVMQWIKIAILRARNNTQAD